MIVKSNKRGECSLSLYKLIWESKASDEASQDRVSIPTPEQGPRHAKEERQKDPEICNGNQTDEHLTSTPGMSEFSEWLSSKF